MTHVHVRVDGSEDVLASWFAHDGPVPRVGDVLTLAGHPQRYTVREVEFLLRSAVGGPGVLNIAVERRGGRAD